MTFLLVLLWSACGALAFGISFAHAQREFRLIANETQNSDFNFALVLGLAGPFGLFAAIVACGLCGGLKHGLKYNRKPEGITWEQYIKRVNN